MISLHRHWQGLLSFTLTHVLATHSQWQYEQRAERWGLAAEALDVLSATLAMGPSMADDLAAKLTTVLRRKATGGQSVQPLPAAQLFFFSQSSGGRERE